MSVTVAKVWLSIGKKALEFGNKHVYDSARNGTLSSRSDLSGRV